MLISPLAILFLFDFDSGLTRIGASSSFSFFLDSNADRSESSSFPSPLCRLKKRCAVSFSQQTCTSPLDWFLILFLDKFRFTRFSPTCLPPNFKLSVLAFLGCWGSGWQRRMRIASCYRCQQHRHCSCVDQLDDCGSTQYVQRSLPGSSTLGSHLETGTCLLQC
jgi:hypothetical protein